MGGKTMPISRADLVKELLPALEKLFGDEYQRLHQDGIEYHVRSRYGKYSIYKWVYFNDKRTSSTLAKGLDKETATGMMKLLKDPA
jgi:hypothetical protein